MLTLYYQEELNLKEIGEVMSIGESRVSQLHSQSIKRPAGEIDVRFLNMPCRAAIDAGAPSTTPPPDDVTAAGPLFYRHVCNKSNTR